MVKAFVAVLVMFVFPDVRCCVEPAMAAGKSNYQ